MKWDIIKKHLYRAYVAVIWVCLVANAYVHEKLVTAVFAFLFMLIILESALDKIATAIRTQRNFHIIGDANEINLNGSSLYADSLSVSDRQDRFSSAEGRS